MGMLRLLPRNTYVLNNSEEKKSVKHFRKLSRVHWRKWLRTAQKYEYAILKWYRTPPPTFFSYALVANGKDLRTLMNWLIPVLQRLIYWWRPQHQLDEDHNILWYKDHGLKRYSWGDRSLLWLQACHKISSM